MSHFSEQQRPGMRRKSSAQNLLSSFKTSNSSSNTSIPPPLNLGPPGAAPVPLSFSSVSGVATPTSSTPLAREWDSQSLHSDAALAGAASPQLAQGMTIEILRELVNKRIITLTYLRSVHEGLVHSLVRWYGVCLLGYRRSHWFHTIQISRADLDRVFNNAVMRRRCVVFSLAYRLKLIQLDRTSRFAILALSLSSLLDINQPQDLLRGLLNTVTEHDQAKEDGDKSKMVRYLIGN